MHKICKLRFVALCVGGMGLTLYDLSQQLDAFPPSLNFSSTLLVFVLLGSNDCSKVSLTPSPNTNSASSPRSCVFTTRALLSAIF